MAEDTLVRPLCKCHGEPMLRNVYYRDRISWACSVNRREQVRKHHWEGGGRERRIANYQARKAKGLCTRCGAPALTASVCWDCLNYVEERYAIGFRSH